MTALVFDDRVCQLGEGPLWHPIRQQLFWFDILGRKLLTRSQTGPQEWNFDDSFSAAGWVDENTLLLASANGLWRFDISTGDKDMVCPLEQDNAVTRSNDGRADPWGGFWIGTMGRAAEPEAGAIYRYYQGAVTPLFDKITISNAISFCPNRSCAYFTDTATRKIMRVALDEQGWPKDAPEVFVDLTAECLNPDGAVTDKDGTLWVALWGAGQIIGYDTYGKRQKAVNLPALHITCPAFGGKDYATLYATSALEGLSEDVVKTAPDQGRTFALSGISIGRPEPQVIL